MIQGVRYMKQSKHLILSALPSTSDIVYNGSLEDCERIYKQFEHKELFCVCSQESYNNYLKLLPNLRFQILKEEQAKRNIKKIDI